MKKGFFAMIAVRFGSSLADNVLALSRRRPVQQIIAMPARLLPR
ncbi:hypothetical protein [Paraburkholderia dinghuensis]|nr:hypothetical protein [Paraburkholderia dinghuensis]